jgi:murein DD-endopeptidase MepM/ murein hydrolase activator NlpD
VRYARRGQAGLMRGALAFALAVLLLAAGAAWWLKAEHHPPRASLASPVDTLGRTTPIDITVRSDPPGLRAVLVRLQTGSTAAGGTAASSTAAGSTAATYELFSETYPALTWRGSGVTEKQVHIESDLLRLKVPEGPATLEVFAETYAWHLLPPPRAPRLSAPVTVDLTPPRIEPLTTQHNMRLGGVELAVFRQSPDTVRSGIEVGPYFFPSTSGYFADPGIAVAFFAIPQDLTAETRPRLTARDAAGNQREVALPADVKPRRFAERALAVDDDFLGRKVPEIERDAGLPGSADLLQGYLRINRELRRQNEAQIRELAARSTPEPLWDGAFHRQSNAAPLSSFADRRTYTYQGKVIDHQTHLGYDLASLKLSPVEAAQNGVVVSAGYMGIYGNTVVVDHGLGIFSLYGHLSTIDVQPGQRVGTGQTLGRTGETGLAGGDHLHFSVMLSGVHVDPVEWWDAHWLRDHVTSKLTMFPRATAPAKEHEQAQP